MEYNNEAKLKEQNSSKFADSKGLAVTKGKGYGKAGGEGGRRGLRGFMFSTHGVADNREKQCSTGKAHSGSVASYYTDGE